MNRPGEINRNGISRGKRRRQGREVGGWRLEVRGRKTEVRKKEGERVRTVWNDGGRVTQGVSFEL